MDNSKLIQALIVDRCEIGQDNTGLPIFILTSQEVTDIANTIVEKLILPVVIVPKGTLPKCEHKHIIGGDGCFECADCGA